MGNSSVKERRIIIFRAHPLLLGFHKNCAQITKPLTELTKSIPLVWTKKQQNALDRLKAAVTSAPVLQNYDPRYPILITTDEFKDAIGAVLEQELSDGVHPVAFISRTLNDAERGYATHELESLGVIDTLRA